MATALICEMNGYSEKPASDIEVGFPYDEGPLQPGDGRNPGQLFHRECLEPPTPTSVQRVAGRQADPIELSIVE